MKGAEDCSDSAQCGHIMAQTRMKVIFGHLNQRNQQAVVPQLLSSSARIGATSDDVGYQYTLNNSRLALAQRAFYEENGFLVIPNLVPDDKIDKWK
ncbi:phytanoyl-CoA dioxygenase, peroxisomal-like [Homarus americanus]|nr:phytanoyl-CoA dioxygenase, peroxisomal-like [Homarus americanus]